MVLDKNKRNRSGKNGIKRERKEDSRSEGEGKVRDRRTLIPIPRILGPHIPGFRDQGVREIRFSNQGERVKHEVHIFRK